MITYEVVLGAIAGEAGPARLVLDVFDAYIDRLCTHAFVDEAGRIEYGIDTCMKTQLQGKLLCAILQFEI